jgi:glutathione S-transferase
MIKLYGTSMSRSARCLWTLEELGLKYEHIPTPVAQAKSAEHLKLNPNGHIPVLDDNGLVIWESMAINLYLVEKYGKPPFWPATVEDHARTYQWSFWAMTELEPHLLTLLHHRLLDPPEQRDERVAKQAEEALGGPLRVLDDRLNPGPHILGQAFTIADLNVASVLSFGVFVRLDMSKTARAQNWLRQCLGREANQKVRALK